MLNPKGQNEQNGRRGRRSDDHRRPVRSATAADLYGHQEPSLSHSDVAIDISSNNLSLQLEQHRQAQRAACSAAICVLPAGILLALGVAALSEGMSRRDTILIVIGSFLLTMTPSLIAALSEQRPPSSPQESQRQPNHSVRFVERGSLASIAEERRERRGARGRESGVGVQGQGPADGGNSSVERFAAATQRSYGGMSRGGSSRSRVSTRRYPTPAED